MPENETKHGNLVYAAFFNIKTTLEILTSKNSRVFEGKWKYSFLNLVVCWLNGDRFDLPK